MGILPYELPRAPEFQTQRPLEPPCRRLPQEPTIGGLHSARPTKLDDLRHNTGPTLVPLPQGEVA
jgi:hypothetical protein